MNPCPRCGESGDYEVLYNETDDGLTIDIVWVELKCNNCLVVLPIDQLSVEEN